MNFILKLKHWQVFLMILVTAFMNGTTIENNEILTTILTVTGGLLYFSWLLLVGHGLYQLLPEKIDLNYNLFIFNSFICLTAYVVVVIISDGRGMTFNGLAALSGFYVGYAILNYLMFPARALKSIEKDRKANIGECIGDFFLILILPIGIWFLQPRINRATADRRNPMDM